MHCISSVYVLRVSGWVVDERMDVCARRIALVNVVQLGYSVVPCANEWPKSYSMSYGDSNRSNQVLNTISRCIS